MASIETTLEFWASPLRDVQERIRPLFTQERVALSAGQSLDGLLGGEQRIPGLPTFDEGPSICLNGKAADRGSEHGLAHQADRKVYLLGSNSRIPGTAPISSITEIYAGAASAATQGRCTFEINKAVSAQPSLNSNILGRTTQGPPDLESDVYSKLQSGTRDIMH